MNTHSDCSSHLVNTFGKFFGMKAHSFQSIKISVLFHSRISSIFSLAVVFRVCSRTSFKWFKLILFHFLFLPHANHKSTEKWRCKYICRMQIGTNNCTARYRTLSGGIGESPSLSPSPSSDYEDDETITKQHLPNLSKSKRNGTHHGAIISQKVTVHHVSTFNFNALATNVDGIVGLPISESKMFPWFDPKHTRTHRDRVLVAVAIKCKVNPIWFYVSWWFSN